MNPTDQINALEQRIQTLEDAISRLSNVSDIPIDVQDTLAERLSDTFLGSATGTGTATTQSIVISSTPTTISVPSQPSGTLKVPYKGVTYELLCK